MMILAGCDMFRAAPVCDLNCVWRHSISGSTTRMPSGFWPRPSLFEDTDMTRMTPFSNPLLLGFDTMEKTLERVAKSGDSYPPYNIERLVSSEKTGHYLRITLAVAGFAETDLDVSIEESQLVVRGRQMDDGEHDF